MSTDIQGTPVQINLLFVNTDSAPPPAPHYLGGDIGGLLREILLAQLSPGAKADLEKLLSTPLDQFFDQAWSQLQGIAQDMVQQAVLSVRPNAYNINVSFPSKGSLVADLGNLGPGEGGLPPGVSGTLLILSYLLPERPSGWPGVKVTFKETTSGIFGSWADPSYYFTFDGEIAIYISVPKDTSIPLSASAEFRTHNLQSGPGNAFAILIGLEDLFVAWITEHPIVPPGDQTVPFSIPTLRQVFAELSLGFGVAANLGFVQLGVQINTSPPPMTPQGATVEFDLTHPFDPAPIVALSTPQDLISPQIGANPSHVHAGDQLDVIGRHFPAAQSTQLTITWNDTTSGSVAQSEVQWGLLPAPPPPQGPPPPPPDIQDVMKTRNGEFDKENTLTTPMSLAPGAWYAFRVRDYDLKDFIATQWSDWTSFQTSATDQVQLVLEFKNTVIGKATLQTSGAFSTTVMVPQNVPPGTYALRAVLLGQQMAQTHITVVAKGQALTPVLEVIDPATGIAYEGSVRVEWGHSVTVRGSNFKAGQVDLFLDSVAATTLGVAIADQTGSFTLTFTWPSDVTGQHDILAQQGTLQATAAVFSVPPPR